jgi:hypothetical protein
LAQNDNLKILVTVRDTQDRENIQEESKCVHQRPKKPSTPRLFQDQQSLPYSAELKLFWWVIGLFLDGLKIIQDWIEYLHHTRSREKGNCNYSDINEEHQQWQPG